MTRVWNANAWHPAIGWSCLRVGVCLLILFIFFPSRLSIRSPSCPISFSLPIFFPIYLRCVDSSRLLAFFQPVTAFLLGYHFVSQVTWQTWFSSFLIYIHEAWLPSYVTNLVLKFFNLHYNEPSSFFFNCCCLKCMHLANVVLTFCFFNCMFVVV